MFDGSAAAVTLPARVVGSRCSRTETDVVVPVETPAPVDDPLPQPQVVAHEHPLVVPQLEHTKQAPARCMTMPHW